MDPLDRPLLVMGERVSLQTERLSGDEEDSTWDWSHRTRPMAERPERAFDATAFAGDLRSTTQSP